MSPTLADCLRDAARSTPDRVLVRDGEHALTCAGLLDQGTALAHALTRRMPVGSVVSFMVPNWFEAAVIYLGATLAGMVVNPILPSLRDHELSFILADAGSRAVFIPRAFDGHDYASMLDRVVSGLSSPPEVVVLRGDAGAPYRVPGSARRTRHRRPAGAGSRRHPDAPLHLRDHGPPERCAAQP